jgi:hypothetical protein
MITLSDKQKEFEAKAAELDEKLDEDEVDAVSGGKICDVGGFGSPVVKGTKCPVLGDDNSGIDIGICWFFIGTSSES